MITLLVVICSILLSSSSSADYASNDTSPSSASIDCYQCFIVTKTQGNTTEKTVFKNTTELLAADKGNKVNLTTPYQEYCPKVPCSYSCALAEDEYDLPTQLMFPTPQPLYATTPPATQAIPKDRIKLEYRVCSSPQFDLCGSYSELSSASCKQQHCESDGCNDKFKANIVQLVIIILSAVISVLVLVFIVLFIVRWCIKLRTADKYREVETAPPAPDQKPRGWFRASFKQIKFGFVRQEVEIIETRVEVDEEHEGAGNFSFSRLRDSVRSWTKRR